MSGADRQFRIDVYNSAEDKFPTHQSLLLSELYALLSHDEVDCVLADGTPGCRGKKCPLKDGLAWTPGFVREGKTRLKANVEGLDFAVFDIDHITEPQVQVMSDTLRESGVELYLHTTHNHLPPNDQSFRLVFPLERMITPEEWKQLWFTIVRKFNLPADKATRDPARLSFFPRAMRGRPHFNERQEGALLDPAALLRENLLYSREQMLAPRAPAVQVDPESIDLEELRAKLRRYDPPNDPEGRNKEWIRRVLEEEPLAEKPGRGFATLVTGAIVGKLLPINTPFEAAFEIMRPAVSKIVVLEGDDPKESSLEAWTAQVERGYRTSQEEKEVELADEKSARGRLVAMARQKRLSPPPAGPPTLAPPPRASGLVLALPPPPPPLLPPPRPSVAAHFPIPLDGEDVEDVGEWRDKMITTVDKAGLRQPKNTSANLSVVLEHHQSWLGVLRYNELRNEPEAHGGPLPKEKRHPKRLITAVRNWFAHREHLEMPKHEIVDAVEFVSLAHKYDPIKEYLKRIVWDGVPRIRSWLIDYCGARLDDDNGLDVTEYVKMVGQKWLMAGAARGLYPGCKADNVLVFEGKQFAGKSKMLDTLGGEWFLDTRLNIGDRSALELTTQNWIIELAELASMKRSETETQKSFFSSRKDSLRLSYAARAEKFPRRCIFAGTTNETQYLLDLTGNRRFWCVWCKDFDIAAIRRDRDQLWAEAAFLVRAGEQCPDCVGVEDRCPEHRWWLDKDQTALTEVVALTRLKVEFVDEIRAWWYGKTKKPPHLTVRDVLVDALGLTIDRKDQHQIAIGRAMKILGFEREQVRVAGGRERVYVPKGSLVLAPPPGPRAAVDRGELLSRVAAANVPGPKEKQ